MKCSKCGYVMDAFDTECRRCHGKGIPKAVAPSSPKTSEQKAIPASVPAPSRLQAPAPLPSRRGRQLLTAGGAVVMALMIAGSLLSSGKSMKDEFDALDTFDTPVSPARVQPSATPQPAPSPRSVDTAPPVVDDPPITDGSGIRGRDERPRVPATARGARSRHRPSSGSASGSCGSEDALTTPQDWLSVFSCEIRAASTEAELDRIEGKLGVGIATFKDRQSEAEANGDAGKAFGYRGMWIAMSGLVNAAEKKKGGDLSGMESDISLAESNISMIT